MPVNGPCPNSMPLHSTVTVLSGLMIRKVFGAILTDGFAAACANNLSARGNVGAEHEAGAPLSSVRRESLVS
jgi:hypothetical protein